MRSRTVTALVLASAAFVACGKRTSKDAARADAADGGGGPADAAGPPDAMAWDADIDVLPTLDHARWSSSFDAAAHCSDLKRLVADMPHYERVAPRDPSTWLKARALRVAFVPAGFARCELDTEYRTRHPWSTYRCRVRFESRADAERAAASVQAVWATCLGPPWRRTDAAALPGLWSSPTRAPYQRLASVVAEGADRDLVMTVREFSPD